MTICCVVAPTLFVALPDRQLAGATAAQFFRIVSMIGLAIGALLLILMLVGKLQLARRWGFALVIATAALPIVSELALGPLMSSARAAGDMGRFGMLHGVAALVLLRGLHRCRRRRGTGQPVGKMMRGRSLWPR